VRLLTRQTLSDIATGATVLGAGGGGDPYIGLLLAGQAVQDYGPVVLAQQTEVPADALVISAAMIGAPTIMVEKLPAGEEIDRAFDAIANRLGEPITHLIPAEAGGMNSMIPLAFAARRGLPVVDGDFMGRAFPEIQMCLPTLLGISAAPMAIADEKGNTALIETIDNQWTERLARSLTIDMGGSALIILYLLRGHQLSQGTVAGSLTMCQDIGIALRAARSVGNDAVEALIAAVGGTRLFEGAVVDVARKTEGGFARAEIAIEGSGRYTGRSCLIRSQNEHLVATDGQTTLASVPDLIVILNSADGTPVTTEGTRYGLRVAVIGIPCDPRWRTPEGLELVGPQYFGYDVDYTPVEEAALTHV
jgi:DUF917 family protein